jgi:hypothetical protein
MRGGGGVESPHWAILLDEVSTYKPAGVRVHPNLLFTLQSSKVWGLLDKVCTPERHQPWALPSNALMKGTSQCSP